MKKLVFEHSSHPGFNPRSLIDSAIKIDRARKDGKKASSQKLSITIGSYGPISIPLRPVPTEPSHERHAVDC
jgi:hypothetical protein